MKNTRKKLLVAVLAFVTFINLGADVDPDDEFSLILEWQKPKTYPQPILEGLDTDTLSVLLDSGNLHWFQPRPDKDNWDVVAGIKVMAPPEVVWDVVSDYELLCEMMPDTYVNCETKDGANNTATNKFAFLVSMIMFSFELDTTETAIANPPYNIEMKTIKGKPARKVEILLVPIDDNKHTLIFLRCYTDFGTAGVSVQLALKAMPMVEPQLSIAAANYANRAYKYEAEKRVGFKDPGEIKPLDIYNLDTDTLRKLDLGNAGLIHETKEGKIISALAYAFVDAPPEKVWGVLTDFDHYDDIFSTECKIKSKKDNQVTVDQETASFSALGMEFGYNLHARYTIDGPDHLSYVAIDGTYVGSHGDFRILPLPGGDKCLLFGKGGINMENDKGIVARIAKSGAFPLENMVDMMQIQSTLAHVRVEAEKDK
jgi:carbon monoxide dehydrogenase subunit G